MHKSCNNYLTIADTIGSTPLIKIQKLNTNPTNIVLAKLEGNNPAGSVKDRAAYNMINQAELTGAINKGDKLIEATSGNTGIALAMVAAIKGYDITLIMPDNLTQERRDAMTAYGAKLILVSENEGMEGARDLAEQMEKNNQGIRLNQFANINNPKSHVQSTAIEIWQATNGEITHFVSAMGTTGTIMGCSEYLKSKNKAIQIIGIEPTAGSQIAGIRKWPKEYLPKIFNEEKIDKKLEVSEKEARIMTKKLAKIEGIFAGISSGGAMASALKISNTVNHATIVTIICDRGDRYLSTGLFNE